MSTIHQLYKKFYEEGPKAMTKDEKKYMRENIQDYPKWLKEEIELSVDTTLPADFMVKYTNKNTQVNAKKAMNSLYRVLGKKGKVVFDVKDFDDSALKVLYNWLHNKAIFKDNESTMTIKTKQSYFGYLLMLFKLLNTDKPAMLNKLLGESKTIMNKEQLKRTSKKETTFDFNDVYKYWQNKINIKKPSLANYTSFILVAILKESPRRIQELINLKWNDDSENNYVDIDKKQFVIRKHKTAKEKGVQYHPISDSLIDDLKRYKDMYDYPFVFITNRKPYGSQMKRSTLNMKLQNTFKAYFKAKDIKDAPKVGIHLIRHMAEKPDKIKGGSVYDVNRSVQDYAKRKAKLLGNTPSTVLNHYTYQS